LGERVLKSGVPHSKLRFSLGARKSVQRLSRRVSSRVPQDFEVCITSYGTFSSPLHPTPILTLCLEIRLIERSALKKLSFEYIVIDEAHRIKNVDSLLSQIVRAFLSRGRLLITGAPLQNNLKELFALLNFICPEIFVDYADLDGFLHKDTGGEESEEDKSRKVVEALHMILRPFLLRRVKADVEKSLPLQKEVNIYVGLSAMQRTWYRSVLEKDIDAVNGAFLRSYSFVFRSCGTMWGEWMLNAASRYLFS
jgi:SWI/SNF-related matrix-associated actin-dependent regulator of chromatin subfamily A member 5